MKLWLHHLNLCGDNVPELSDFYRNVMTLGDDERQNLPPIHLEKCGVPYSDWGSDAVKGWHQVFFYDPVGNVIEVHQVLSDDKN
ncbi:MAG: hypothetical protein EBW60_09670 [Rhodobacteraceae bacterium]|nr:hypothetical protein [Paracoccaceae bacterium]